MGILDSYNRWLNSPKVDESTKEILRNMNQDEIDDAFFKDVEFGTAGMRGVLGPGTNRLNSFTIKKAAVGFSMYLLEKYPDAKERGVVISHDNRHMSREFTLLSAEVLNDFGIKAYIFDSLRPTPELSFAVRYTHACGGIMITASHNPKEYNGFKVYDDTGCQLVPSKISRLVEIIASLPNELEVEYDVAPIRGETITLDKEVDDVYVSEVEKIQIHPELDKSNFKIVFTPNHGTSYVNLMRIFKDCGYEVYPVEEQCVVDPDFSATECPNPEDPRSFVKAIDLAYKVGADIIIATDPDGDRVGLAYHSFSGGDYKLLTGNDSASLLFDYICSERIALGTMPSHPAMYSTIVSTPLGEELAHHYGVAYKNFLTGFKYIGNQIAEDEAHNGPTFIFGFEESYGCLISPIARDKDGLQAALLYAELALFSKLHGRTLGQTYDKLSEKVGYHLDMVKSIEFKGASGSQKMNDILNELRTNPLKEVGGAKVVALEDYLVSKKYEGDKVTPIDIDKSNVLIYKFDDRTSLAVRPSGTEPKIKFYVGVVSTDRVAAREKASNFFDAVINKLNLDFE